MNDINHHRDLVPPSLLAAPNRRIVVRGRAEPSLFGHLLSWSPEKACLSANRHVPPGETVELEVYLNPDDPFPIRLQGVSIWSSHLDGCPIVVNLDISSTHRRNLEILSSAIKPNG